MFIEEDVVNNILKTLDEAKARCNSCSNLAISEINKLTEERNSFVNEANFLSIVLDLACQRLESARVTMNNKIPPSYKTYRKLLEEEAFNEYEYRKEHGGEMPYETR